MAIGRGRHAVNFTGDAAGGVRRSSRSWSTFHLAIRSVGIRLIIAIAILAREIITGIATATETAGGHTIAIHTVTGAGAG